MMIASTGYLYAMGSNAFGKLGIGTRSVRNCVSPTLVELKAKVISCGFNHTVSLAEDGTVYAWGDNSNG